MSLARTILGPSDYDEVAVAHSLLRGERGVMVDVGAHHGGALVDFAIDGWSVFCFEPDPTNRAILLERTAGQPKVRVDERAISEVDGEEVSLFTSKVSTGISSMAAFHPSHQATATDGHGRVRPARAADVSLGSATAASRCL
jgi:FkbM family methyltransferase